ncbi:MAG: isoprenylcysteine carboxylmethyltransferase family protein [Gemmatimonadaceae bacterium]|nr:isoprenylcysteine carboxylmethyltransferase family protein [Gemmatimonadaceae bacterium]
MTYSEWAKKLRLPLGFILGGAYLVLAKPTLMSLALGIPVALLGVVIRGWASGHISKNEKLATGGPYAHTRNPLYFGSFLIAAGFALAVHWSMLLLVIAFFVLIYAPTMEREKANIGERFPDSYDEYSTHVPAFVPRVLPWKPEGRDPNPFSLALYMKHGEWKAGLTFFIVSIWLYVRATGSF